MTRVTTDVVVLNGGSSSGKTSLARALQELLPELWLRWSIDDLVDALPAQSHRSAPLAYAADGGVTPGAAFRRAETAWLAGLASMARTGTPVLVDDVFLSGSASQERVRAGLEGLRVLWVGVRCAPEVAAAREAERGDRPAGMAAGQATVVHQGVRYDVEVDTSSASAVDCARTVLDAVERVLTG